MGLLTAYRLVHGTRWGFPNLGTVISKYVRWDFLRHHWCISASVLYVLFLLSSISDSDTVYGARDTVQDTRYEIQRYGISRIVDHDPRYR